GRAVPQAHQRLRELRAGVVAVPVHATQLAARGGGVRGTRRPRRHLGRDPRGGLPGGARLSRRDAPCHARRSDGGAVHPAGVQRAVLRRRGVPVADGQPGPRRRARRRGQGGGLGGASTARGSGLMCGIAGAIPSRATPGERARSLVQRINQAQRHRGPDGDGVWSSPGGEVVFGHRRLAILDLSPAGAQPMLDRESGCAVTFNGEIYNFAELRRELQAEGDRFLSSCDTEVVLKAYARWGIDAMRRFRGIFALALWDPRARAVHLVRDPMGIKPLYWTVLRDPEHGGEIVLFASELRALLATGAVARRLDPAAVASFLWHGFVVGPHTIVEGVHLLPAASVLTLTQDAARGAANARATRTYWQMPSSHDRVATAADVRAELRDTVRMQLI